MVAQVISDSSLRAAGGHHDPEPRGLLNVVGASEDSPKSGFLDAWWEGKGAYRADGEIGARGLFGLFVKENGTDSRQEEVKDEGEKQRKGEGSQGL